MIRESEARPSPAPGGSPAQASVIRELQAERDSLRLQVEFLRGELQAQNDYAAAVVLEQTPPAPRRGRSAARGPSFLPDMARAFRAARGRGPRGAIRLFRDVRALRRPGAFDADFYFAQRPDLLAAGVDPVWHYVVSGAEEGLDPSPAFSTRGYAATYPDVAEAGLNPLAHYLRHGVRENRQATPAQRTARFAYGVAGVHLPGGAWTGARHFDGAGRQDWAAARRPELDLAELPLYDRRPDDPAPVEGARGERFLHRHGLLSAQPDFAAAVEALNTHDRRIPPAGVVDVSVVIPVYGQLAYTLNCLDALLPHATRRTFEIIIVDDASPDASGEHLPRISGVRYIRQPVNGGFIASCNTGAAQANGRWLVFLNNDTRVVEGWLDALIDSFELFPRAGLVGSKLFYPDGSLQEAGGIVWRDASGWNYGRNDDPNKPEYCHARQADYVSGASIAVPADLWRELGGFDQLYAPAYFEDTDLAFRIRRSGREVWLQPLSRVVHYEGKTSGTDLASGAKAYQVENQRKFFDRWRDDLVAHRENGRFPELERERNVSRRVLVIEATTPTPDQDAGSVWVVNIIKVFQELGYKVTFAPIDNFLFQERYSGALHAMGVECLYAPYVSSLQAHLAERGHLYEVVHVFRFEMMALALPMIRKYCRDAELVFNNHDLHFLRLERQAEVEQSAAIARKAQETKARELKVMAEADVVCVPSTLEKQVLEAEGFARPVAVMPFMTDLSPPEAPWSARKDVVFLGGFAHPPNIDGAVWMVEAIWSRLADQLPGARLLIVGSNPTPEIKALASDTVLVTGRVDDLRPLFEAARVFVAPLRFGAGVKGKIFTAFAHGVPVVTTGIGAEGMGLVEGLHAVIADDPEAFAALVRAVYGDEALWRRLSRGGIAYVEEHATVRRGVEVMAEIIQAAEQSHREVWGAADATPEASATGRFVEAR